MHSGANATMDGVHHASGVYQLRTPNSRRDLYCCEASCVQRNSLQRTHGVIKAQNLQE